jgi:hypothetical protein
VAGKGSTSTHTDTQNAVPLQVDAVFFSVL